VIARPTSSSAPAARSSAGDALRLDATDGSIRRPDGERLAAIPAPLMQSLHFALVESLGETAQDVLYRSGYEWALQDMLRLNQQLRGKFGGGWDFWQADAKFILESWWAPLDAAGWGVAAFDCSALNRGITFVELRQSIAAALVRADQPVCHLHAGLLAGALSFFDRHERHAVEVQCRAMGKETCTFIVGPGAEVDSAEAWRQQGTPAAEIVRRLR
jgi:uncharacterized protein